MTPDTHQTNPRWTHEDAMSHLKQESHRIARQIISAAVTNPHIIGLEDLPAVTKTSMAMGSDLDWKRVQALADELKVTHPEVFL